MYQGGTTKTRTTAQEAGKEVKVMENQMMNMEELEQVAGGNILDDAWDWLCDKAEEVYDKFKPNDPFDNPIYWKAGR